MSRKRGENLRKRVITEFEFMVNLPPSKLARYLRMKLACNQGCPPANLMHVFTLCQEAASCDDCWWLWLNSEHKVDHLPEGKYPDNDKCWDCRWGARGDNAHPFVACMNKKFYGIVMDPDDYCSFFDRMPERPPNETDIKKAEELGELNHETAEAIGKELRRRYEIKAMANELQRRLEEKADGRTES